MQLWRLVKTRHASTAFDGEVARLYGARWNSRGTWVAYAASNSALAVLEVLVHMAGGGIPHGYSMITASLDVAFVRAIDPSNLPREWRVSPVTPAVQAVGDAWIRSGASLALRVPSALVPDSFMILINPEHPKFDHLIVESIEPFEFDSRLLR